MCPITSAIAAAAGSQRPASRKHRPRCHSCHSHSRSHRSRTPPPRRHASPPLQAPSRPPKAPIPVKRRGCRSGRQRRQWQQRHGSGTRRTLDLSPTRDAAHATHARGRGGRGRGEESPCRHPRQPPAHGSGTRFGDAGVGETRHVPPPATSTLVTRSGRAALRPRGGGQR